MASLSVGVVSTFRKADERRLAIHPAHVERIPAELRARMVLEHGYGERFGVPDAELAPLVGAMGTREEVLSENDVVLLPKPLAEDLEGLRPARSCGAGRTASRTGG